MQNYRLITKKGEGTFSEVIKAQSVKTNQLVAIKCMKQVFQTIDQVLYFNSNIGQQTKRNSSFKKVIKS
ncbi:unnamed protein product [Paramecium octaurelia]|uniref:Protein kinase domain-containing protein n=1 Tax=Paramecium octaurelia TaxID=43137 RepID=A0A8S1V732_PAROT|nr:unnamed protein product [Paramecium octaurelia]